VVRRSAASTTAFFTGPAAPDYSSFHSISLQVLDQAGTGIANWQSQCGENDIDQWMKPLSGVVDSA
jgi:hypothetical protein